jgi:hypothetical protein
MERERLRRERKAQRAAAELGKERKRRYLEGRAQETEQYNVLLAHSVKVLEGLLSSTLAVDDTLDFEVLKEHPKVPRFDPGRLGQAVERPALMLGAPLLRAIDKGLAKSRAGIVLVTPALLNRVASEGIADKELSELLARDQLIPVVHETTYEAPGGQPPCSAREAA